MNEMRLLMTLCEADLSKDDIQGISMDTGTFRPKDMRGKEFRVGDTIAISVRYGMELRTIAKIANNKVYVDGKDPARKFPLGNPEAALVLDR